jgi:hypothetical protein
MGIDTDPTMLADLNVDVRDGIRFDEVIGLLGKARFAPVFHRPLFRHLGFVTNRTFETFCADTLPVLMLPHELVTAIYGPAALELVPGDDVAASRGRPESTGKALGRRDTDPLPLGSPPLVQTASSGPARAAGPKSTSPSPACQMNILFVMEHRVNAGNTHAVATYGRVAEELGHTLAFYGPRQADMPGARFSVDPRGFDRVIYLIESKLYRVGRLMEVAMLATVPRAHRYVLDADARYNPVIVVDGYDRNYLSENERAEYLRFYDALAERIIKPTLAPADDPRVMTLPFFGFDPTLVVAPESAPPKQYDILHVGHNWWRWKAVKEELLPAFEQIRAQVGEIGFAGLWWDRLPEWALTEGWSRPFASKARHSTG